MNDLSPWVTAAVLIGLVTLLQQTEGWYTQYSSLLSAVIDIVFAAKL